MYEVRWVVVADEIHQIPTYLYDCHARIAISLYLLQATHATRGKKRTRCHHIKFHMETSLHCVYKYFIFCTPFEEKERLVTDLKRAFDQYVYRTYADADADSLLCCHASIKFGIMNVDVRLLNSKSFIHSIFFFFI